MKTLHFALGFLLLTCSACGASVTTTDAGSDASDVVVPPGDEGTLDVITFDIPPLDTGSTFCPGDVPTAGAACAPNGTVCTYGTDPRFDCRPMATCNGGTWAVTAAHCAPTPGCPASDPANLSSCSTDGVCAYPDGLRCTCAPCPPGGPACVSGPLRFYCTMPPTGCPASMPNLGTACTVDPSQECTYDPCTAHGVAVRCTGGVWVRDRGIPCPA